MAAMEEEGWWSSFVGMGWLRGWALNFPLSLHPERQSNRFSLMINRRLVVVLFRIVYYSEAVAMIALSLITGRVDFI